MEEFSSRAHRKAISTIVSILWVNVGGIEVQIVRVARCVGAYTPVVPVRPNIVDIARGVVPIAGSGLKKITFSINR